MPEFKSLIRWERFEPDLGSNRELEPKARFYVELAVGATKEQLRDIAAQVDLVFDPPAPAPVEGKAPPTERPSPAAGLAKLFEPWIRLGKESLVVDGKPVTSLAEYFGLFDQVINTNNLIELPRAFGMYNSVNGARELFFERLSGGSTSTARQPKNTQRAAH